MKRGNLKGKKIKALREKLGLNHTELAVKLTVSEASMFAYEADRRCMPQVLVDILLSLKKGG